MNLFILRVTPVLAFCLAPVAPAFAGAADPTQAVPSASLPAYRSAFSEYKPFKEDKPGDWRALNDAVKDEGMADMPAMGKGHEGGMPGLGKTPGHAMPMAMPKDGAAAGSAKAGAPAAAASMPAMKGVPEHSMHGMPGGKP